MKNTEGLPRVWVRSREERCQKDIKRALLSTLGDSLSLYCLYTNNLPQSKDRKSLPHGRKERLKKQTNSSDSIPQKKSAAKKTASIQKKIKV